MKISVIVASSNSTKNELLYNAVCKAAKKDDEVLNFGVFDNLLGKLDKNMVEKAEKFLKNCKMR